MPRPSFSAAWTASQRIYDPANPGAKVAKVIGGNVEKNINNPVPAQRWDNTCAVRMSYKDMVLATCMAQAYRDAPGVAIDAGSSVGALRDWTYFDLDRSPDAVQSLVDSYLARDYSHPLVEAEIKGVRFDFLKCMDLYHSKALEDLVKRLVIDPKRRARR